MARKKFIAEPDTALSKQELLFDIPGHKENSLPSHPPISRKIETLESILSYSKEVGIDFEFTNIGKPTIVSVTSENEIFAAPWSPEIASILKSELEIPDTQWVAHSGISADRPVVEATLGIKTPLSAWDDSMVTHYLCNQHLTKAPAKEESDDAGALGFMDLWTMASLTTKMFNWKKCRGVVCYGPCPAHSPIEYCGVDAWAGLMGFQAHQRIMKQYGVPHQLYRDLMEVGEICYKMEQKGIHIDKPFVDKMELDADARKNLLFPVGEDGKQTPFNPRSVKQVTEWFKAKGIDLRGTDKKIIYRTLEKEAVKNGFASVKEISDFEGELPEALQQLYNLHEYKDEGKGLDAWFGPRYVGKDGLIHPRFVNVGTSTGRLSSSKPNFQNIPARGFGDLVRRAIVAPEGFELLKSDFGQLELRMCLYLAGVGPEVIGKDAFYWLVDNSEGLFLQAAALYDSVGYAKDPRKAARNIAKRVCHSSDYLEGIKVFSYEDLEKPYVKNQITKGALRIYSRRFNPNLSRDWEYFGGVVGFTGVNLAEGLFGSATFENRKKALNIQEDIYFKKFFAIREWQMKVTAEIEAKGYIKSPTGRFMRLYDAPHEMAKIGVAWLGQGVSADHVQGVMLRYHREFGEVPIMQVHDELVFEKPQTWTDKQMNDFIDLMRQETYKLPGFKAPIEVKRGKNWKDLRLLEVG